MREEIDNKVEEYATAF